MSSSNTTPSVRPPMSVSSSQCPFLSSQARQHQTQSRCPRDHDDRRSHEDRCPKKKCRHKKKCHRKCCPDEPVWPIPFPCPIPGPLSPIDPIRKELAMAQEYDATVKINYILSKPPQNLPCPGSPFEDQYIPQSDIQIAPCVIPWTANTQPWRVGQSTLHSRLFCQRQHRQ